MDAGRREGRGRSRVKLPSFLSSSIRTSKLLYSAHPLLERSRGKKKLFFFFWKESMLVVWRQLDFLLPRNESPFWSSASVSSLPTPTYTPTHPLLFSLLRCPVPPKQISTKQEWNPRISLFSARRVWVRIVSSFPFVELVSPSLLLLEPAQLELQARAYALYADPSFVVAARFSAFVLLISLRSNVEARVRS